MSHAVYGRGLGHHKIGDVQALFPRLVKGSFSFAVVRDPFSRLMSAYNFAKAGKTADMGVDNPQQYQIPEFRTFDSFVQDWLVYKDASLLDYIFQPQTDFVCIDGEVSVDFVAKVETLENDLKFVAQTIGHSIQVRHLNKTGGQVSSIVGDLSQSTRETILSIYSDDFLKLGYST